MPTAFEAFVQTELPNRQTTVLFAGDPSASPGKKGPIGMYVLDTTDSYARYEKTGTGDTDWNPVGWLLTSTSTTVNEESGKWGGGFNQHGTLAATIIKDNTHTVGIGNNFTGDGIPIANLEVAAPNNDPSLPAISATSVVTHGLTALGRHSSTAHSIVLSGGNIGVGTNTPVASLHIRPNDDQDSGRGNSGGAYNRGKSSGITPTADFNELFIENADNAGITIASGVTGTGGIAFESEQPVIPSGTAPQWNPAGQILFDHSGMGSMVFGASARGYMVLSGDGRVGIGTWNPTEMLTVSGNISASNTHTWDQAYDSLQEGADISTARLVDGSMSGHWTSTYSTVQWTSGAWHALNNPPPLNSVPTADPGVEVVMTGGYDPQDSTKLDGTASAFWVSTYCTVKNTSAGWATTPGLWTQGSDDNGTLSFLTNTNSRVVVNQSLSAGEAVYTNQKFETVFGGSGYLSGNSDGWTAAFEALHEPAHVASSEERIVDGTISGHWTSVYSYVHRNSAGILNENQRDLVDTWISTNTDVRANSAQWDLAYAQLHDWNVAHPYYSTAATNTNRNILIKTNDDPTTSTADTLLFVDRSYDSTGTKKIPHVAIGYNATNQTAIMDLVDPLKTFHIRGETDHLGGVSANTGLIYADANWDWSNDVVLPGVYTTIGTTAGDPPVAELAFGRSDWWSRCTHTVWSMSSTWGETHTGWDRRGVLSAVSLCMPNDHVAIGMTHGRINPIMIGATPSFSAAKLHVVGGTDYTITSAGGATVVIQASGGPGSKVTFPVALAIDGAGITDNVPRVRFLNDGKIKWQINPGDNFEIFRAVSNSTNWPVVPSFQITSADKVGIGGAVPDIDGPVLAIGGSVSAVGALSASDRYSLTLGHKNFDLQGTYEGTSEGSRIVMWSAGSAEYWLDADNNTFSFKKDKVDQLVHTSNEEWLILGGNVGIGSTSFTPTAKLTVQGTISATGATTVSNVVSAHSLAGNVTYVSTVTSGAVENGVDNRTYKAAISFAGNTIQTYELDQTGISFIGGEWQPGRMITVRLTNNNDGRTKVLSFPTGWVFLNNTKPPALAHGRTGILSMTCYGEADTDVVVGYAASA